MSVPQNKNGVGFSLFTSNSKLLRPWKPRFYPLLSHAQGRDLEEVVLNIKCCPRCGKEAVAGDDWQGHGYLLLGNKLAVYLTYMDAARRDVQGAMTTTKHFDNLLRPLADEIAWMTLNKLVSRWVRLSGKGKVRHSFLGGGVVEVANAEVSMTTTRLAV